jgi:hypothetical protein
VCHVLQASRTEVRQRRKLEGMHERHLESRSLDLQSCTSQFERDKLLYYQAVQNPSVSREFVSSLRTGSNLTDDSARQALLLSQSWAKFSSVVEEQAVCILSQLVACPASICMPWQHLWVTACLGKWNMAAVPTFNKQMHKSPIGSMAMVVYRLTFVLLFPVSLESQQNRQHLDSVAYSRP